MLISCSSCNSKYLVNSADLKPNGRTVQCVKCGHSWFQSTSIVQKEVFSASTSSSQNSNQNSQIINLPSTYVTETKPKIINSILVLISLIFIIIFFWLLKNNGMNFFVLINYYTHEFYFNVKLIINDFAEIIYQILK